LVLWKPKPQFLLEPIDDRISRIHTPTLGSSGVT
jgi:hypothetical protein